MRQTVSGGLVLHHVGQGGGPCGSAWEGGGGGGELK